MILNIWKASKTKSLPDICIFEILLSKSKGNSAVYIPRELRLTLVWIPTVDKYVAGLFLFRFFWQHPPSLRECWFKSVSCLNHRCKQTKDKTSHVQNMCFVIPSVARHFDFQPKLKEVIKQVLISLFVI